ncbi:heterogene nuclear ribonucleoprotein 1-like [Capsicum annuum]
MDSDETKRPRTETNKGKEKVGDSSLRKLLVEDIAVETTEESLREHFNQFGKVIDSVIITNENSGRPWRYGVVTYADSKGANTAYGEYHNINNREVHVKKEAPKEDMHVKGAPKTEKKFIGGLPPFDDDSKKDFSSLGFVISDDEEAVEKVSADGCMHELHGKQVEIKRAEPKSAGAELASENQLHHGGSISKSHRGDSGSVEGFGGAYGGNMGAGHGGYGGYEGYGNYGGYRKVAGSYGDITLYMVDTVMEAAAMVHLMPAVTDMGAPLAILLVMLLQTGMTIRAARLAILLVMIMQTGMAIVAAVMAILLVMIMQTGMAIVAAVVAILLVMLMQTGMAIVVAILLVMIMQTGMAIVAAVMAILLVMLMQTGMAIVVAILLVMIMQTGMAIVAEEEVPMQTGIMMGVFIHIRSDKSASEVAKI